MAGARQGSGDRTVDLLVVGSGAGAMTAALVAHDRGGESLLIEKSDRYGGSSAMSGGGLWVPGNHLMAEVGLEDSPEDALLYLRTTTRGRVAEDRLRAYLESTPEMARYLTEHSCLGLRALPEYADYYPEARTLLCRSPGWVRLGIDARRLEATVRTMGEYARTGKDLDFGRGESIFDRYYGDQRVAPNPCLGPLEEPPYYACRTYPGDFGTTGGLRTDAGARVLTEAGEPIPGLYAAGNCSAFVMGGAYPGAGCTLGPAMTFGYIAARNAIPA